MKPYPTYKDSGVEWLGQVPEGWEIITFKRALARNDGGVWGIDPVGEGDTIVLRSTEQTESGEWAIEDPAYRHLTEDDRAKFLLKDGDILVTKSSGSAKHIGKATLVSQDIEELQCCYSNFMQRLRVVQSGLPKFYWYFLNNGIAREQFGLLSNSTTGLANLSAEVMNQVITVFPPLSEQQAIAAFLDRETAKIDGLIEEQRRLIALLAEKRQATISHAVTRGLNPSARLKPSGADWIGDIPEGWKVVRLAHFCDFQQGKAHEPYFDDEGRYICVTARFVSTSGEAIRYCSENLMPAEVDDILMVMSDLPNGRALARAFHVKSGSAYAVNQRVCRITVRAGSSRYFFYQLNRHPQLLSENDGANQTHLSNSSFTKLKLLVPPKDEQAMISDYLDEESEKLDALTETATSAITLLQERRAALISAAVTGKIDVRDLATVQKAA